MSTRTLPLQALIFDTRFDAYRGVVMLARFKTGTLKRGQVLTIKSTGKKYEVQDTGIMHPELLLTPSLFAGQVGCIIANVRTPQEARVGDTIVLDPATDAGRDRASPNISVHNIIYVLRCSGCFVRDVSL
jgi:translation elongation factor EF-4